jgi:transposase
VRCRYDEPGGVRKVFSEDRDRAMVGMQREGASVEAIAVRFGVSRRTVFRALAKARVPSDLRKGQDLGRTEKVTGRHARRCVDAPAAGLRRIS